MWIDGVTERYYKISFSKLHIGHLCIHRQYTDRVKTSIVARHQQPKSIRLYTSFNTSFASGTYRYWDHKVTEAPRRMDISLPFSVREVQIFVGVRGSRVSWRACVDDVLRWWFTVWWPLGMSVFLKKGLWFSSPHSYSDWHPKRSLRSQFQRTSLRLRGAII